MPKISCNNSYQTVITTFETSPGDFQDLIDELEDAYNTFISHQKGFIGAAIHGNDAQTRVANYSQWEDREDFLSMLRTEEMRKRNRKISSMCKSFEPVMYDVDKCYE